MCALLLNRAFLMPLHRQQLSLHPYLSLESLAIGHSHQLTTFQYHRWRAKSVVCYDNERQRKYHIPIRNCFENTKRQFRYFINDCGLLWIWSINIWCIYKCSNVIKLLSSRSRKVLLTEWHWPTNVHQTNNSCCIVRFYKWKVYRFQH